MRCLPPRDGLATLSPHPLGHDRYLRLVNELGQVASEFGAAGYPELAGSAVAARHAVQDLWTAVQDIERVEERDA